MRQTRLVPFAALALAGALAAGPAAEAAQKSAPVKQKTFPTAQAAADSLLAATETFDVDALKQLFGPDGIDLVVSGDAVQDKNRAATFTAKARAKMKLEAGKNASTMILLAGEDDWPLPIPIVKSGGAWRFDSKAGKRELLYRRIGENELDAIQICRGYVEAQIAYAYDLRQAGSSPQYAQRIISTPGKRDGLAWQDPDGKWKGPVGEAIAKVIAEGYSTKAEPYHGYFFKVLKAQGSSAPLGKMDFVVKGMMIGGYALVAAPAEYEVSGIKSFIVSHDGVVYEKDLGPKTLETFKAMERFDPDKTWSPVIEQ